MPETALADGDAVRRSVTVPKEARMFVREVLSQQCDQAIDTAELLVSELVTNARRHGGTEVVEVKVRVRDGRALLAVFDPSPELPRVRQVDPNTVGGRGLLLVERLAHQWGVDPTDSGKNVWVELSCDGHVDTE